MEKALSVALYAMLIVIFLFSIGLVIPVYKRYRQAQQEVADLDRALMRRKSEYLVLRDEVHDLEHKSSAVEKVAREKFRYSRESEVVYLYTE
ncbi:MAG: septum formation initiator family protein [Lentisphaeria bacterium]|jgi:cell division protein FtsB|nr:septum formation initiator family protein [Lentisphaeria bacterium]